MNSFANSLFSLLFGWARALIQQVWNSAVSGQYNGFFVWLGNHWVWLVLIICLACTAMDFLIWLVRWRPYLVWRSALRRLGRRIQGKRTDSARRFAKGYQGGVELDISPAEEPKPQQQSWEEMEWQEEAAFPQEQEALPETLHTFTRAVLRTDEILQQAEEEFSWENADGAASRQRQFPLPEGYEPPPVMVSTRRSSAYSTDLPAARRKRRSEKYERRRAEWRERLIKGDEDEDTLLDGLPPAVDRQQAFHEPVLPHRQEAEKPYSAWQRPVSSPNPTDGNHA